jgi:phosphoribosylanthranilate isomerase
MTVRIKVCGINSAEAMDAVAAAGAEWAGLVFFPPSPRFVSIATARALAARAPRAVKRVGLFVEPTAEQVAETLRDVPLHILQVYGTVALAAQLRGRFGIPVWRAIGVASAGDLPREAGSADAFVIEAKPPPGANRPGGNAAVFNWELLRGWRAPAPWLLAGGLHSGNVGAAIRASGAEAVDVSSGVETAPGVKSPDRIASFAAAVRSCDTGAGEHGRAGACR